MTKGHLCTMTGQDTQCATQTRQALFHTGAFTGHPPRMQPKPVTLLNPKAKPM